MPDRFPKELKFCYWGNPIIRKKTIEIENPESEETGRFVEKMMGKLKEHDGLGLAANQVNCDRRICLVTFLKKDDYSHVEALINPHIIEQSGEIVINEEGCLSFPKLYLQIPRREHIKVRAYIHGKGNVEFEADGLMATIILHETDHLDGVVFIDHLSQLRRTMIRKELRRIAKEYNE